MGMRLSFMVLLAALSAACKGTGTDEQNGDTRSGRQAEAPGDLARDPVEAALMRLGIEGRPLRIDLNQDRSARDRIRIAKVHTTPTLLLLETTGDEPSVYALARNGLGIQWVSNLREPSLFPAVANNDTVMIVSKRYAHAFETETGKSAFQFVRGAMAGIRRPWVELPYEPTGGPAVGNDTFYIPSLGNPRNNKNLESFSLITGQRGWGYRAPGSILTAPVVGGDIGDPKLYFLTSSGLVTCVDATNYGYAPRGERWQELAESPVEHGIFVTEDTRKQSGSVYFVDDDGLVYCLNRITGDRRWVAATGRKPAGHPMVFGDLCVVPMKSGLSGFDAANVTYVLRVTSGADEGRTFRLRTGEDAVLGSGSSADIGLRDGTLGDAHAAFKVSGEVLTVSSLGDEENLRVNGGKPTNRAVLRDGSTLRVGNTTLVVEDLGSDALWHDLDYDGVVANVGGVAVARSGTALVALKASSGEPKSDMVEIPGGRLFPANTSDATIYLVADDAVVYAYYAR